MISTLLVTALLSTIPADAQRDAAQIDCLQVDPLLIEQAAEVWKILATDDNPLWPGWNASKTPLLFYLPGKQDVLINHPDPPEGFRDYHGPIQFPGGKILLHDGKTLLELDGQNTAIDVNHVRTLVVADTLSNRIQQIRSLIEDPRPAAEKLKSFTYQQLSSDPISSMGMIAHEAFHVFQNARAPDKGGNELALIHYPTLDVDNNVGFALESQMLAAALTASDDKSMRGKARQWLAVRKWRRAKLSESGIAYEDGTEFNEGLAKYIEYRLTQALETRQPSDGMWRIQGFRGYSDLSWKRTELIEQMRRMLSGEVNVNNDPYGASPARMRLYFSGMAIAALLDRLAPSWHDQILQPETTLTGLVETTLGAPADALAQTAANLCQGDRYEQLVREKTELRDKGGEFVREMLSTIQNGPHTALVIDHSDLGDTKVAMSFTPFGILAAGNDCAIFRLVPVSVRFETGTTLRQTQPSPLLRDEKNKQLMFQLASRVSQQDLLSALKLETIPDGPIDVEHLELPGVVLEKVKAVVTWQESQIRIRLVNQ